jgi:hypothetical protein
MKGLQGERLRQAFRFFDHDGDGYIKPDQFQRIIVVRIRLDATRVTIEESLTKKSYVFFFFRKSLDTNYPTLFWNVCQRCVPCRQVREYRTLRLLRSTTSFEVGMLALPRSQPWL